MKVPIGADRGTVWVAAAGIMAGAGYLASSAPFWPSLLLFVNLFALALYDWHSFRLPNLLTAVFFISGGLYLLAAPYVPVADHLIGAAVGLFIFPAINFLYKRLRGRDGIGMGDAKLLAGIGLWMTWQALPFVLLTASLTGLMFAGLIYASKKTITRASKLPFGTFLCFGCWTVWLVAW